MTSLPVLFAAAAVLAACLALVAAWCARGIRAKALALALLAAFLPLGFAGWVDLLSRPKPIGLEWLRGLGDEARVVAGEAREGVGIFVWLDLQGGTEPRAYALPWNREQAEQLQKATREAQEGQGGGEVRMRFEHSLDPRKPMFYAPPQPALPEKGAPPPAQRFVQPEQAA